MRINLSEVRYSSKATSHQILNTVQLNSDEKQSTDATKIHANDAALRAKPYYAARESWPENSYKWVTPRAGASKEARLVEYVEISSVNEVLVWSIPRRVQWRAALGGHRLSALRWWHQESSNTYWCSPQPKVSLFWLSSVASSWMRKSQWSNNLFPSYQWLVECNNPERYRLYDEGVCGRSDRSVAPVWRTHVRVWLCIAWVLSVSVWCAASSCLVQKGHDCHLPTLRPLSRRRTLPYDHLSLKKKKKRKPGAWKQACNFQTTDHKHVLVTCTRLRRLWSQWYMLYMLTGAVKRTDHAKTYRRISNLYNS